MRKTTMAWTTALVLGSAMVASAAEPASGKVKFRGKSWSVADALAYPGDDGDVAVVLTSQAIDRK